MVVALVHSPLLVILEDLLPANVNRSSLVAEMIGAYKLAQQCEVVTVKPATKEELSTFHDASFVGQLLKSRKVEEGSLTVIQREKLSKLGIQSKIEATDHEENGDNDDLRTLEKYGLLYDCPIFPYMDHYIRLLAGSTITSARYLRSTPTSTVINWHGGRHHAKRSSASGFCYVNDIVLGILELRKTFDKVVYLDLDLHHGDGVEGAFKYSDKVVTISVHRKEVGFFPGTGDLGSQGMGKGKSYTFNAPMKHGFNDASLTKVMNKCVIPVIEQFGADCIVVQCGADGLGSDEHQEWNLTVKGMGDAIDQVLSLKKSVLLLGGGGYNHSQVARCWTYLTHVALSASDTSTTETFDLLPDSFIETHPEESYEFWSDKGHNMIDENTDTYIDYIASEFQSRIKLWS